MWTSALRLSHLNGGIWTVNGELNTIKETVGVRGNFTILNMQIAMSSFPPKCYVIRVILVQLMGMKDAS
jgi:hypothetical protein